MRRVGLLLAILVACSPGAEKRDISNMTEQNRSDLEHQLVAAGYDGLFLYGERSRADTLWAHGGNQMALEGIIGDATTSLQTKFLAAELLRTKGVRRSSAAAPACAEAYAAALASTSETAGNPWRLNGNVWASYSTRTTRASWAGS